ncbi:MAG: tetratricopeptide repeat protein [Gammaproteobacteria bacterium]|nr:tetratricopeptide repeat protein [Gammaproteobacteria bacterium]
MTDGDTGNECSSHACAGILPTLSVLWVVFVVMFALTGCAGGLVTTGPDAASDDMGATRDTGRAVATLLAKVETQEGQAHWERAAALLERALRIEPRNAQLWHRLAKVRLQQGRYGMAESLAQKSSALAKDDEALKRRNAELIEIARRAVTTS